MVDQESDFTPWLKYPDLTQERLGLIADLIRKVRKDALALHDPDSGDGLWSLGCRVYQRTCYAIRNAADRWPWLEILPDWEKPLRFTFAIGRTPLRFYHGDAEDPPSRYLVGSLPEIRQRQMVLQGIAIPADGILRLAVETNPQGDVSRVLLVEMDEDRNITGTYPILFETEVGSIVPLQSTPVDLPAPIIELVKPQEDEKREARNASTE